MQSSPTSSQKRNQLEAIRKFKEISLTSSTQIRERYGAKPITFLKLTDDSIRFPKKIADIFALIWLEQDMKGNKATRFIIKGPRGGGKSKLLGAIGFAKWYFQNRKIVDMGGSLEQAKGVYNYFAGHIYSHDSIINGLPKAPLMQNSVSDLGGYFKAVAASPKQIRGPHPDNLFIDEACETKDDLILSALPMINTSEFPLVVMTSTFHKIFGYFQEVWDHANELGYVRYSWDIFDVMKPFDSSIWDDKRLNREIPDFADLKKRAKGRTGDVEGWVHIDNVIQAFREKNSIDWFDVEYMGSRPSASGMINDPEDVDAAIIENLRKYPYKKNAVVIAGLDWGFSSMTSWVSLMKHVDDVKVQIHNHNYTQTPLSVIIEDAIVQVKKHMIRFIYADSAGKFENDQLQAALTKEFRHSEHKCTVIEVVFSKEKVAMVGNYRTHFQRNKILIPKSDKEAIWQHKRYRYQEGTDKPMKKDDHVPDATMCALQHWPMGKVASMLPKSNTDKEKQKEGGSKTITGGLIDERF